jgi:hypothetical protein
MKTPAACPWFTASHNNTGAHKFLSFFLILLAFALTYNIAGIIYNQRRHRRYGLEAVPHIEKWRKAPKYINQILFFSVDKMVMSVALAKIYARKKYEGYK